MGWPRASNPRKYGVPGAVVLVFGLRAVTFWKLVFLWACCFVSFSIVEHARLLMISPGNRPEREQMGWLWAPNPRKYRVCGAAVLVFGLRAVTFWKFVCYSSLLFCFLLYNRTRQIIDDFTWRESKWVDCGRRTHINTAFVVQLCLFSGWEL